MLDILCVGDAKIDIFLKIPESNPHFGLDKEQNKLFITYGEKIHVEKPQEVEAKSLMVALRETLKQLEQK